MKYFNIMRNAHHNVLEFEKTNTQNKYMVPLFDCWK